MAVRVTNTWNNYKPITMVKSLYSIFILVSVFLHFFTSCNPQPFFLQMQSFVLPFFCRWVQLILVNNCKDTIWPGLQGGAGHPSPEGGGFQLGGAEEVDVDVPDRWSGRIWGRQGCYFDNNGKGTCATGGCSGQLHCQGTGGKPPATVVEMTLGSSDSPLHFNDVSLVDGFNLPVAMAPIGGGAGCGRAECEVDLNVCCPLALEVKVGGKVVGCKSACLAMGSPTYCCKGEYANPKTCKPTVFSKRFKAICPKAYS